MIEESQFLVNSYLTHMFFAILGVTRQYGKQMFLLS